MKRPTPLLFAALTVLAFLATAQAQTGLTFAFVDTQTLIRAHPASAEIERLGAALEAELGDLAGQLQELAAKRQAGTLTAEEEELLQALNATLQTRQQSGLQEIRQAAAPAEAAANEIIRELAAQEGYALVLDIGEASGLVVYAAEEVPDLTERAVQLMQERHAAQ